jgi:glycosyltransferase involved in cell wall biosynthesis
MPSIVSLVMTVYNRENYLRAALDSILIQTYPHWYLTLWDDGSTDSSADIAREYANLDPRIRVIAANHAGQTHSLYAAMKVAQQRYIDPLSRSPTDGNHYFGWVDSDDLLDSNALAVTVAILDERPQIGMVYTDYREIDSSGRDLGMGHRCQIPYSKERLLIDFMTFHFRLIRQEIYDLCGGVDLTFEQAQDYDLCLKISEVTEIYHHPQPLYYYRIHPTMISQTQKTDVTAYSAAAVRKALVRQGLSDRYYLNVSPLGLFQIRRKIV